MRPNPCLTTLLSSALSIGVAPLCKATTLDLSLKSAQIRENRIPLKDDQLKSGLGLALQNRLVNLTVDYDIEARVNARGAVANSTSQRVGTTVRSALVDQLLGVSSRLKTSSLFRSDGDIYSHRINPGLSTPLLSIATVDLNYQYLLNKASPDADEQQTQSYTVSVRGALPGGWLNWSGAHNYQDDNIQTVKSESFKLQSAYHITPRMKLRLSSNFRQQTRFVASQEYDSIETRYGAGLSWSPSEHYSLDVKLNRHAKSDLQEKTLLRSGRLSWFPSPELAFTLDYGDQLLEGGPGVMLNTRLELDRF